ncbi:MAG: translation initiation factor Sui1 [Chlamydiota bacterium]|nr:translation initiation factor Sui1 [Chlamydiota bacterium]
MENCKKVYSTEYGKICPDCNEPVKSCLCKKKRDSAVLGSGIVRVSREAKGRGGKTVTVIKGLAFTQEQLRSLATELKRKLGVGGAVKEGNIEMQGDHVAFVIKYFASKGIQSKRSGG